MNDALFSHAGFLQFAVTFGDITANVRKVDDLLHRLQPAAGSVIVLPELWATGFDYARAREWAANTPGLLEKLREFAAGFDIFLGGSLIAADGGNDGRQGLFNTFFLVGPAGVAGMYRKQHLFGLWQEDLFFARGGYPGPIMTPRGPLGVLVCYDLRFPETARRQCFAGAKLIVVAAQWPKIRLDHWLTLLRARAVENQVFIAACNGCGTTGEHELGGHSLVIGPNGKVLTTVGDKEDVRVVELSHDEQERLRSRFCPVADRPYPVSDKDKIYPLDLLLERLEPVRRQGSSIAFTNGCFDILHSGHVAYLEQARKTADCLVVGLNSDSSVRKIKGPGRPVNDEVARARVLAALGCVDFVVLFSDDTPINLIKAVLPDVLVKGADWPEDEIVGAAEVKKAGGRVVRIAFEHDQSTTGVITRIRSLDPPGR
jgi:D-glycero-beta-D-manno-heptose 1-phosphate adenylyltransferase